MKYCYYRGTEMREGLSFCTKCGKAVLPSIQPIQNESKTPRPVEIKTEHLDSNQQAQANKVADDKLRIVKSNTDNDIQIKQSLDSDELSTAVNSTFRELANLTALEIRNGNP